MDERVILAMDGATPASTAAVLMPGAGAPHGGAPTAVAAVGWRVLARRTDLDSRGQARVLLRLVDDMLREIGRDAADIGAIVTGIGPGTFTGVRIAVATARALALALAVPILGVSTLSSLVAEAVGRDAYGGGAAPDVIVPVVDARRGQLFYGLYRRVGAVGEVPIPRYVRADPFAVCDRDALFSTVAPGEARTLIAGDLGDLGAAGEKAGISLLPLQVRAEHLLIGQDALGEPGEAVEGWRLGAWLAGQRPSVWPAGEPGSPEAVKPIYVRSPDADIHITKMRDPWADASAER
jgi:tRNA threonylcarbamoyladenosine biosynthesis protein TsaB